MITTSTNDIPSQNGIPPHLQQGYTTAFVPPTGELSDTLKSVTNIIKIKPIDPDFFQTITEDPKYQKSLETLTFSQQKLVNNALLEIGENPLRHGLKNGVNSDSELSVTQKNYTSCIEIEIKTENLLNLEEINEKFGNKEVFVARINAINEKSVDDLKDDHSGEMQNTGLNANGGGNLGFINIAKKIKKMYQKSFNKPFNNVFTPTIVSVNDHIAKLVLIVRIPLSKEPVLQ